MAPLFVASFFITTEHVEYFYYIKSRLVYGSEVSLDTADVKLPKNWWVYNKKDDEVSIESLHFKDINDGPVLIYVNSVGRVGALADLQSYYDEYPQNINERRHNGHKVFVVDLVNSDGVPTYFWSIPSSCISITTISKAKVDTDFVDIFIRDNIKFKGCTNANEIGDVARGRVFD